MINKLHNKAFLMARRLVMSMSGSCAYSRVGNMATVKTQLKGYIRVRWRIANILTR